MTLHPLVVGDGRWIQRGGLVESWIYCPHGEKAAREERNLAEEAGHDGDCELEIGDWRRKPTRSPEPVSCADCREGRHLGGATNGALPNRKPDTLPGPVQCCPPPPKIAPSPPPPTRVLAIDALEAWCIPMPQVSLLPGSCRAWVRCHPANPPPPRTSTGPTSHTARARGCSRLRRPKSYRPLLPCRPCDWRRPLRLPRPVCAGFGDCGSAKPSFAGTTTWPTHPGSLLLGPDSVVDKKPALAPADRPYFLPPVTPLPLSTTPSTTPSPAVTLADSTHPSPRHHPNTLPVRGRESPPWRLPRRRRPWTAARLAPTPAGASTCEMTSESWSHPPGG